MFKAKMDRELKKYQQVQNAYYKIKQQTGVVDAQEIVEKFLTREQTYGELLANITENEKKIDELKLQMEQQNTKLDELKQEYNDMENKNLNKRQEQESNIKNNQLKRKLETSNENLQKVQLEQERIYQWCIQTLNKMDKLEKQKITYQNQQKALQQQQLEEEQTRLKEENNNNNNEEEGEENNNSSQQQNEEEEQKQEESSQQQQQEQRRSRSQYLNQQQQQEERVNYYEVYPREKLEELINLVLEKLLAIKNEADEKDIEEVEKQIINDNVQQEITNQEFYERNTRALPPLIKKNQQLLMNQSNGLSERSNIYVEGDNQTEYQTPSIYDQGFMGRNNTVKYQEQDDDGELEEMEEKDYMDNIRNEILRERDAQIRKKKMEEERKRQKEMAERQRHIAEMERLEQLEKLQQQKKQ